MTSPVSTSTQPPRRRPRAVRARSRVVRRSTSVRGGAREDVRPLDRYVDAHGCAREVTAMPGAQGSVLVVDRDTSTRGDGRLVAHLGADEPSANAVLVSRHYVEQARSGDYVCRPVADEDWQTIPFADLEREELAAAALIAGGEPCDTRGNRFRLKAVEASMSIPELRWVQRPSERGEQDRVVSLRDAVGSLERYEPACGLTLHALWTHRHTNDLSTSTLGAELTRVRNSPIVLNRQLREAVLARVDQQQLSMSEIAMRCGRVKKDRNGNESGETSWLARRLGLLPEAGQAAPTPWVHSEVLGLIARRGLGLSPRETEVT